MLLYSFTAGPIFTSNTFIISSWVSMSRESPSILFKRNPSPWSLHEGTLLTNSMTSCSVHRRGSEATFMNCFRYFACFDQLGVFGGSMSVMKTLGIMSGSVFISGVGLFLLRYFLLGFTSGSISSSSSLHSDFTTGVASSLGTFGGLPTLRLK